MTGSIQIIEIETGYKITSAKQRGKEWCFGTEEETLAQVKECMAFDPEAEED